MDIDCPVLRSQRYGLPDYDGLKIYLLSGDIEKSHNIRSNCAPENLVAKRSLLVEISKCLIKLSLACIKILFLFNILILNTASLSSY
jgi:hypothetical protein